MRMPRIALVGSLLLVLPACAGTGSGTPDGGDGIYTWGAILDFLTSGPVDGAHVCIKDTERCADTDVNGEFLITGLEADTDYLLSIDDNRYFPAVGHMNSSRTVEFDWNYTLPTEDAAALQVSLAGSELERGKGQVFIAFAQETGHNKPRVAGMTVQPSAGSEALGAPVYGNDLSVPDPSLTETGTGGTAVFVNVDPGVYSFEVAGDDDCFPYFSMNSPDDGTTYPVHVFANTLSAVTIVCPQN